MSGRGGHAVVDVAPEDVAFISRGCGVWSGDLSPVATPGEPFGDGVYILNVDVAPGRYRASTPESCSWARLFTFGGEHSYGHGAQGFSRWADGLSVVDVAPSDAGFLSRGCGRWSATLAPALTPGAPFGDGTWLVGIDVAPGRYFARAPSESCSWHRLDGFGGIDEYHAPDGWGWFSIVDIAATDAGFESSGCGTWTREPPPAPASPVETFGDGTWRVGIDIEPGRYFASAPSEDCYWYRLDGFGGYEGRNLGVGRGYAWREPTLLAVVDVAPPDVGFASQGCGTWTAGTPAPRATPGEAPVDGLLLVGHEVAPGRYRATPRLPATCVWDRLGAFAGRRGDEVVGSSWRASTTIVDIAPSDAGFSSRGCGWRADWAPAAVPGEPFGDGTWIVGAEIEPGRYRQVTPASRGGRACAWKRVSGFGGTGPEVIASGEEATVEIAATDTGFISHACGGWRQPP